MAPQKSECPVAAGQVAEQSTERFGSLPAADLSCNEKTLATLTASFALAGFAVHRMDAGFAVCRWNLSRHCPDLRTLAAFAKQVGAAA